MRLRLKFFDKFVLFVLALIILVRAPFVVIPAAIVIYMCYTLARSYKEAVKREEKRKRKQMKKRAKVVRSEEPIKEQTMCSKDELLPTTS